MDVTPGKQSTEHARSWRAEVLGALIVAFGLFWHDVVLCGIGAALVAVTVAAYAFARASHKAASSRPAPVLANPRIG